MSSVRASHESTKARKTVRFGFVFSCFRGRSEKPRQLMLVALALAISTRPGAAQDLVTPVRVGDPDAPMTLSVWAQQDYSHLAARPAIAAAFTAVFDDWARAHPDVQLRVSVMPGLELHKAKLQLAAAARPAARRRVDRQLLAAAAGRRRAAAGCATGRPRIAPTSCRSRSRRCRIRRVMSTGCGTRPIAACCSTARIWSRRRRAPGTS